MGTPSDLTILVREDVERQKERLRKRDEIRAAQDNPTLCTTEPPQSKGTCKCGADGGKLGLCIPCQKQKYDGFNRTGGKGHPGYVKLLEERLALHLEKSGGYGTGSDPFANFTAVAGASGQPRYLYPILRAIEKLTRCLSLHAQGRADELGEEFSDIASLMDCAEAMRREDL